METSEHSGIGNEFFVNSLPARYLSPQIQYAVRLSNEKLLLVTKQLTGPLLI
jgi:hypothetical protein